MKYIAILFSIIILFSLCYGSLGLNKVKSQMEPSIDSNDENNLGNITIQNNFKEINSIIKKHDVIGMGLCVAKRDTIIYSYHYGLRNLVLNISVDEKTLYRVASISKVVTAIGVMQLVEKGEISLDSDINNYLNKGVRNKFYLKRPITIRMLLSHTSSLYDGPDYESFIARTYSQEQIPAIYELFDSKSNIWINRKPGTFFNYSNLNYGILATIIENVVNERFDRYIYENVLEPLNIDGGYNVARINSRDKISVLYRAEEPQADNYQNNYPKEKEYPLGINGHYYSPQGGLRISVTDLTKILQMLMNYGSYGSVQLLKKESVIAMESEHWINNDKNGNTYHHHFLSWGLGLQRTLQQDGGDYMMPGLSFFGHHGDAYGLLADLYYNREKNIGFVFISNGTRNQLGYLPSKKSRFSKLEEDVFEFIYQSFIKK